MYNSCSVSLFDVSMIREGVVLAFRAPQFQSLQSSKSEKAGSFPA